MRSSPAVAVAAAAVLVGLCGGCLFDENGVVVGASVDGLAPIADSTRDAPTDSTRDGAPGGDTARDGASGDTMDDGAPSGDTAPSGDATRDTAPAPDTTRDTAPSSDTTRDTAPPPDTTRDTAPPPDSSVDSGPPIYIDESFNGGPGVLSARFGTWTYPNGKARQQNTKPNGALLSGSVPVADYVVETSVRIHGIAGLASIAEGAGVAARIQPSTQTPPPMYACILSPDAGAVYLVYSSGGSATGIGKANANVRLATDYVVRLRVVGNQLTCTVPAFGVSITRTNFSISAAGKAGVVTFLADASFAYLRVTAP